MAIYDAKVLVGDIFDCFDEAAPLIIYVTE